MSYTVLAVLAGVAAATLDLAVLRTDLLRRKLFWAAYGIVICFQLLTNGLLAGLSVVRYDEQEILGPRLAFAPIEDLLFGFALVLVTLSSWVWLGRRGTVAGRGG